MNDLKLWVTLARRILHLFFFAAKEVQVCMLTYHTYSVGWKFAVWNRRAKGQHTATQTRSEEERHHHWLSQWWHQRTQERNPRTRWRYSRQSQPKSCTTQLLTAFLVQPLRAWQIIYTCTLTQEKRIYDLKWKNQELEKFKFVLDYKIKELRRQMEPRENEIKLKTEQIKMVRKVAN